MSKLNDIIKCLNAYLSMLIKLDNLESLFKEYLKLMLFDYNFKEVRSKSAHDLFVTVKKMHFYPIKFIFVANRIPLRQSLDSNLKVVKNLMKHIRLSNSIISVLTDESNFNSIKVNFETYKGIDIKKIKLDKYLFKTVDLFKVDEFPKTNLFLKNNPKINVERKIYTEPERIISNSSAQLSYKKESSELHSLTSVNLLISNDQFKKNAKQASVCDLILVISEIEMQELFFQIREAGFLYKVEFNRFGFNIVATGSDEVVNVFKQILTNFKNVATDEKLKKAKKIAIKNYENALANKFLVYLDIQNCLLFQNNYTIQQRMAELDKVTLSDLNKMMNMIFNKSRREYLIQGNYTVKDSAKFFNVIEKMFDYKIDFTIENTLEDLITKISKKEQNEMDIQSTPTRITINQTYNVNNTNKVDETTIDESSTESEEDDESTSQSSGTNQKEEDSNLNSNTNKNELFPKESIEYYCLAKLGNDSPEPVFSENSNKAANEYDLSIINTPNASFAIRAKGENKRYIESTSLKNPSNRKLFLDTKNHLSYNASKIERTTSNCSGGTRTKSSSSALKSICTDITNTNYNLSPLNISNESDNYSNLITQDSQIVCNLYFTYYSDEVQHSILLRLLVELIKQHMNGFFTNELNLRDNFFSADKFKNKSTPEITFQDQVVIDGQIECVEFELANSKGFIFIVFDNYHMINTKSIDSLAESFLSGYMFSLVDELEDCKFNQLIKQLNEELIKKLNWAQDVTRNWHEIVIGKRRFELREQQKSALKNKVN